VNGATDQQADDSLVTWATVIYGLHAFSLLTGIIGTATVVGAFLTGWPSIIAVILNYVKRSDVRGTWLESHFRWQIRTFWFALLWVFVAFGLFVTIIGIPLAWLAVSRHPGSRKRSQSASTRASSAMSQNTRPRATSV